MLPLDGFSYHAEKAKLMHRAEQEMLRKGPDAALTESELKSKDEGFLQPKHMMRSEAVP